MRRVFVAGLYSKTNESNVLLGCMENIRVGISICQYLIRCGYAPFCPWLDFMYFLISPNRITEDQIKKYSLAFLPVCEAVLVLSNRPDSGVNAEIKRAEDLGIPVFHSMQGLNKYFRGE